MKITTLIENRPDPEGNYAAEHGLSMYIEFDGKTILFDTGQTGNYLENAEKMGIDVSALDYMVLSHGHYDHSGGVMKTLPLLPETCSIYLGEGYFNPKYKKLDNGTFKYNGNGFPLKDMQRYPIEIHTVKEDVTKLSEHIWIFKNFKRSNTIEKQNPKFYVRTEKEAYELDEFQDEIVLGLETMQGLVVLVGCSHIGILNILTTIRQQIDMPIHMVIGGTHLVEADEDRISLTCEKLRELGVQKIAVSHCTGEAGMKRLQDVFGRNFIDNCTGHRLE